MTTVEQLTEGPIGSGTRYRMEFNSAPRGLSARLEGSALVAGSRRSAKSNRPSPTAQAPTIDFDGQSNQAMATMRPTSSAIPKRMNGLK
jgi:hypothetical protein